jgi:hypothetical protein
MIVISEHVHKSDIGLGLQIMCFTSQPILHLLCVYMSRLFIRLHVIFAMYKFRHHKQNKNHPQYIAEILLKLVLNTITLTTFLTDDFSQINMEA